jgi:dephospho-CoA kinase
MKVLGLTGGIGMGKSTADQVFRSRGVPVIDTDLLARQLVEPGQPALQEIIAAFGAALLAPEGRLDRRKLGLLVFSHPEKRQQLEAILHPRIRARWRAQIEDLRQSTAPAPLVVVVIPLLFETNAQTELDATVCIACSAATQRERLQARGWSTEEIQRRNQAQWPVEKKMAAANFVVWTEGSLEVHAAQLARLFRRL